MAIRDWFAKPPSDLQSSADLPRMVVPAAAMPSEATPNDASRAPVAADFLCMDVETANADMASICAIGLVPLQGRRAGKAPQDIGRPRRRVRSDQCLYPWNHTR